jgi:hypothetical protein
MNTLKGAALGNPLESVDMSKMVCVNGEMRSVLSDLYEEGCR